MVEVNGLKGISARVLKHSKSSVTGTELVTFELTYPRLIHSELMTHQMLPKNAASSRAIPFSKMREQLGAQPVRFGQANPGMQDRGEDFKALVIDPQRKEYGCCLPPEEAWEQAMIDAGQWAEAFYNAGYHKQVYNRLTEPFQFMKTVISGTEWNNFFWLRNDPTAADPTIAELARVMYAAKQQSVAFDLNPGEWHLPYIGQHRDLDGELQYFIDPGEGEAGERIYLTLEQAIQVSSARTAAVSFRNTDYGIDKSQEVYGRLVGDERKHGSAMAHQATPMWETYYSHDCHTDSLDPVNSMNVPYEPRSWQDGITHVDREGNLWSAHYKGFIQHRKLIPGENIPG